MKKWVKLRNYQVEKAIENIDISIDKLKDSIFKISVVLIFFIGAPFIVFYLMSDC